MASVLSHCRAVRPGSESCSAEQGALQSPSGRGEEHSWWLEELQSLGHHSHPPSVVTFPWWQSQAHEPAERRALPLAGPAAAP